MESRFVMEITVARWGTGVAVPLPPEIGARVPAGSRLDVAVDGDRIILSPTRHRYNMEDLLAGMTPEREHVLEDDGPTGVELL